MSTNRRSVMLVSMAGPTHRLASAIDSALEAGLDPVVLVPATMVPEARRLLAERLQSDGLPRVFPIAVHSFRWVRTTVRNGVTRVTSLLGRTLRRVVRAFRARTAFGRGREEILLRLEPRVEAFPTKVAGAVLRVLVDKPLGFLGRAITEFLNIIRLRRISLRLSREGMLIGVVCHDGRALIPGWYISRMSPTTPVLTAYPDDWNRHIITEIERFERGAQWI